MVSYSKKSKPPAEYFFRVFLLIFIYIFKYKTIVRSSAYSFGHSDPDPSSVQPYRLKILLVLLFETFKFDPEPKLGYD